MSYLRIINYRGGEVNVKRPDKKQRSDRKYTVKTLLTEREKRILNVVMLELGYDTILEFVTVSITNHLHLAIIKEEIQASKRKLKNVDGIQINGRLSVELYEKFRKVQAVQNLTQRQLVHILIGKAIHIAGYRWN